MLGHIYTGNGFIYDDVENYPIGACKHCGAELYNDDYIIDGQPLCAECYHAFESDKATVEFFVENPDFLVEYLKECQPSKEMLSGLADAKEWLQEEYEKWYLQTIY